VSLSAASVLSVVGLVFPFMLGRVPTGFNQSVLMLMMLGIAGAFFYGAGFSPEQKWLRAVMAPVFTWPLMALSFGLLVWLR
jgi:predicted membrane protein